jgi:hypothetical protein
VIVVSLLLILVDVALLAVGLMRGSTTYLVSAIVGSLLAALVLIASSRRAGPRLGELEDAADEAEERAEAAYAAMAGGPHGPGAGAGRSRRRVTVPVREGAGGEPVTVVVPSAPVARTDEANPEEVPPERTGPVPPAAGYDDDPGYDDDAEPPDEPAAAPVSPADAVRLAALSTEVFVVDGRPRYHLASCVHLVGRDSEALPVSEAVELGFTPCSRCEPDTALLAAAGAAAGDQSDS